MRIQLKNKGFTLVEVLVAMVILAIGLLGLASLQSLALKDNQDAYLRSQANFLAYEMSDRMRANATYWHDRNVKDADGNIIEADSNELLEDDITAAKGYSADSHPYCNVADPPDPPGTLGCTPTDLARYDVYRWWKDASVLLPGIGISMVWADDANTNAAATDVIRLTLTWSRSNQAVDIARDANNVSVASLAMDVRL